LRTKLAIAGLGFSFPAFDGRCLVEFRRFHVVNRRLIPTALTWALIFAARATHAWSADYWLADQQAFPGGIWHAADGDAGERLIHRRQPTADPVFPRAFMKVGQIAAAPDGEFYFCSGLDGCVLALLDGRHEVLSFEFGGQIRDLSCGGEEHVVYFSVVPTPQNDEPLPDGKIYRRDLWAGEAAEVATIHQAEVGGNWWGTFCVRERVIYLATTEPRSRLFRVTGAAPEAIYPNNTRRILGLEANGEAFVVADGTGEIVRTIDFTSFEPVHSGPIKASDVTVSAVQ
jgi:hypothetical protein